MTWALRNPGSCALFAAGLLLCTAPSRSWSQDAPGQDLPGGNPANNPRYEALKEEALRLESRIRELNRASAGQAVALEQVSLALRLTRNRQAAIEEERAAVSRERAELVVREQALQARAVELTTSLRAGLRRTYALGQLREYRVLLTAERADEFLGVERSLRVLAVRQQKEIGALRGTLDDLKDVRAALAERDRNLVVLDGEVRIRRTELEAQQASQRKLRAELDGQVEVHERALAGLRADLAAFESFLQDPDLAALRRDPASGKKMLDARGSLPRPVPGKVLDPFGVKVHPRFKTRVPHPGWDLEAAMGTPVHAVHDGEVVFAQRFQGFGLTVILDHGNGVKTIYAHLDEIRVKKGQWVVSRQLMGLSGDSGSLFGPRLYFELRYNGQPADPADWLKRQAGEKR